MSRPPHPILRRLWREAGAAARAMEALTATGDRLAALDPDLTRDPLLRLPALDGLLSPEDGDTLLADALSRIAPGEPAAGPRVMPEEPAHTPGVPPEAGAGRATAARHAARVERRTLVEREVVLAPAASAEPVVERRGDARAVDAPPKPRPPGRTPESRIGAAQVIGRRSPPAVERHVEHLIAARPGVTASDDRREVAEGGVAVAKLAWLIRLERALHRVDGRRRTEGRTPERLPGERDVGRPAPTHRSHGLARLAARFAQGQAGHGGAMRQDSEASRAPERMPDAAGPSVQEPPVHEPLTSHAAIPHPLESRTEEELGARLAELLRREALRQGVMLAGGGA